MKPLQRFTSRLLVLPEENIDTDQIIPARFLTTTAREGLGQYAFVDWRRDRAGDLRADCALNDPRSEGCAVLVPGRNFGCGSSREHAPWALFDMGVRAIICSEFADIFRSNAAKNGIVPIVVPEDVHRGFLVEPWAEVEVDLESCTLERSGHPIVTFSLEPFARRCLLAGVDELGFLLANVGAIERFEEARA